MVYSSYYEWRWDVNRHMRYLRGVTTLELSEEKCTGCGMCQEVCPHEVIKVQNGLAVVVDRDSCMECGACSRNCPDGAIVVQAGVGCAQAVINSALGRKSSSCCSLEDCDTPDHAHARGSGKQGNSGCC